MQITHPPVAEATTQTRTGSLQILLSIAVTQLGAAVAARLFARVGPDSVVMMRQGFAACVLMAWTRPRLRGRSGSDWMAVVLFGAVFAAMSLCFYQAVNRLPLGVAVTIELLGPLSLSAALSRRRREFACVGLALFGVVLLGETGAHLNATGIIFVLLAALGWASYIVMSKKIGERFAKLDGLAIAMTVATLCSSPFGLRAGAKLLHPAVLATGMIVALLSAIIPFSLDITALRTVSAHTYGTLMSLSPAFATVFGVTFLGEEMKLWQLFGIVCVMLASARSVIGTRR